MQATDHYRAGRSPSGRPGLIRGVLVIVTAVALGVFVATTGLDRQPPDPLDTAAADTGTGSEASGADGMIDDGAAAGGSVLPDGSAVPDPAGAEIDVTGSMSPTTPTSGQTASTLPTTTASTAPAVRPPGEVTVLVLNASGTAGIAAAGTDMLDTAGYSTLTAKNADEFGSSAVLYTEGYRLEAAAVAAVFGVEPAGVTDPLDPAEPPMDDLGTAKVIVLVGFDGVIDPA